MRLRTMLAAMVVLVLVAVAPEASGGGGTPITSCGQVVFTNAFLVGDLFCPGSDGVVPGADGITIDLKGHTLRGDRTAFHAGIDNSDGRVGVTIKNGVVRNFTPGVDSHAADSVIINVLAAGNNGDGILVVGDSAKIQSSTGVGNSLYGIRVVGDSAKIQSSNASSNGSYGILVEGDKFTIQSSTVSGNANGIRIDGDSAKIQSSSAISNRAQGFWVVGNAASVKSSRALGNGGEGIFVSGDAAKLNGNRAEANGYFDEDSDLAGLGINVINFSFASPPTGKNTGRANDSPYECFPDWLC